MSLSVQIAVHSCASTTCALLVIRNSLPLEISRLKSLVISKRILLVFEISGTNFPTVAAENSCTD